MLSFKQLYESNNTSVEIERERDRILDKISGEGIKALTNNELLFLKSFKNNKEEEVFNKQHNTFEDELFIFEVHKMELNPTEEKGFRYKGKMSFKKTNSYIEGSIYELESGKVITVFEDGEDSDYDMMDFEDLQYYDDFLHYVVGELRQR